MSTGVRARGSRAGRAAALALAGALALGAAGCGSEEDFANEPRPPAPIEVSARVDSKGVIVSPDEFGAGLVVVTVANLSNEPVRFALDGPTTASIDSIAPDAVANLKTAMEQGTYEATAGDGLRPDRIAVGPPRKTSQNQLLLP